jgi:alcohol dehydrogenase, propanol-preferring
MQKLMSAMLLTQAHTPLVAREIPIPTPAKDQVLLRVLACGVCRTDLHILDGELPNPILPLVMGHEIVGEVLGLGSEVHNFQIGQVVGVPWLGHSCGECQYCQRELENLCEHPGFTGYTLNGGYAQYTVADYRFCFPIPATFTPLTAAPLLCAGLIGYRAFRSAGMNLHNLGVYGFGAAAHILTQIAVFQGVQVYAFTVPGDTEKQNFARHLGAVWAGGSDELPPQPLDAAILFAPVGALVPVALRAVRPAGRVVCAGIHMSNIPSFPYHLLWLERSIHSVANLTRADGIEFFNLISSIPLKIETQVYPLLAANQALEDLRNGRIKGAAVLTPE